MMPVSSIQSGHAIIQQSQNMAKKATEELNEQARLERTRLEENRQEEKRIEAAQIEEARLESQLEKARHETARLEELQSKQEHQAQIEEQNQREDYQESFNALPSAEQQRDINAQKEQQRHEKEVSATEAAAKLAKAKSYNSTGTSVVSRSNEMIGTMLDISV